MATSPQSAPICEVSLCSKKASSKAVKPLEEERFWRPGGGGEREKHCIGFDCDRTAMRSDVCSLTALLLYY